MNKFNTYVEALEAAKKAKEETKISHKVAISNYQYLDSGVKIPIWSILPDDGGTK